MEFGLGSYGFGFLAGLLSTLSPCVLPIIPILLGSATNAHPRAPLALAGGLAVSYALIGTGLAWADLSGSGSQRQSTIIGITPLMRADTFP
jgi:cytochrome c biogenesis protein CcdA